jgi:hypothetical protein
MHALTDVYPGDWIWTQPDAFCRAFALRAGDKLVAALTWQKRYGSLALAE